ncbi:outer membrane beta-barrel family protein [Salegentibacter sediminis]|uniref:outer membrane beta-barrel family protein n=1 Tax=Salegentibacter sediminis TaxID=1930251 RepID=UPI0009C11341|nr:outer membrane beta-barrel family protein [Salegentibacter sediminis]
MKLYRNLFFSVCLLVSQFVLAQEGISGKLEDQKEETVPFATVSVIKLPDSTLVTGTTSDIDGNFNLKPSEEGEYVLKFSAIGYADNFSEELEVSGPGFNYDLGVILLSEETTMLDEVMLKSWKPRMKVENGNVTMEVEGTTMAAGNNAYEMLVRAPGVSADQNGNFKLNGRSGVSVMLDGRLTYLSQEDLKNLLESMPAENIKSIEVMNNPPSKYDAEGSAGMLNINLKKNSMNGFSGSVYAGYTKGKPNLFNSGTNFNFNQGNWSSFINLDVSERGTVRDAEVERIYPEEGDITEFQQQGRQEYIKLVPSVMAGSDVELNETHSAGVMAQFNYTGIDDEWLTDSQLYNNTGDKLADIASENYKTTDTYNGRLNFHHKMNLDTAGTSISTNLDYAFLKKDIFSEFYNAYVYPTADPENEILFNESFSNYDIYAGQVDFNLPLRNGGNLETGVKASKVVSKSNLDFYIDENGERVFQPENSDSFRYEEEIYAAYAEFSKQFNETWSINAGLRLEQTNGLGISASMGEENKKEYLEFFPNLQLNQKVSDNYELTYSYNRRIKRPAYDRLNPFQFFIDPYNLIVGNPNLRPQFSNSFSIIQNFFSKYNLSLQYESITDYNTEIFSVNEATGITKVTTGNLDNYSSYMASLIAPVEFTSFWNSNNSLILNYQDNQTIIDGIDVVNESLFYMLQSNHQINLPADFKLELNATLQGPMTVGIYYVEPMQWLDAGIKRSFIDNKLDVTLRFTDIFKSQDLKITSEIGQNQFNIDQYFNKQAVSLNLRYNFSKGNSKKNTRSTNTLEEMDRAGVK